MIRFAKKVIRYTQDHDQTSFIENEVYYDATLRNIELIGEAATHIPPEIRKDNPEIPWRQIIATRNRIIHGYLGIDDNVVWSIIIDEIADLLDLLQKPRAKIKSTKKVGQIAHPSLSIRINEIYLS
jgi:uncharacterized protein with HEPN domain